MSVCPTEWVCADPHRLHWPDHETDRDSKSRLSRFPDTKIGVNSSSAAISISWTLLFVCPEPPTVNTFVDECGRWFCKGTRVRP